jgi:thiol-disulfide isomerase/thioredoxin
MAHQRLTSVVLLLAWAGIVSPVLAQPPGDTLADEVGQAYQQIEQYRGTTTYQREHTAGRMTIIQKADIYVAFDRGARKLKIDRFDLYVVVDGDQLLMRSERIPGKYLEKTLATPWTYETLVSEVPFLTEPELIDVAFLLSETPVAALAGRGSATATVVPAEPGQEPDQQQLKIETATGSVTMTIDAQTKLLTHAVKEVDLAPYGQGDMQSARTVLDYEATVGPEVLADDAFAFDRSGQAVGSLAEWMQQGSAGSGAGGGGGSEGGHALVGKDVPDFEVQTLEGEDFKLSEAQEKVIVLDFWATWCPPCRKGLPKLQEVYDWAKQEGKSVAVYAVNVRETVEEVQPFWTDNGFTMPVLMDTDGAVSEAYAVTGIPQTVIISDGKVQEVHVGFAPDMEQTLKAKIDELLAAEATE